jgi:hypothetical protein
MDTNSATMPATSGPLLARLQISFDGRSSEGIQLSIINSENGAGGWIALDCLRANFYCTRKSTFLAALSFMY